MVCGQDDRIEPGDDEDEDDIDVGVEPDVLGLVLLEPVVVAEEVGRVRHPQSIHIVLRLPPQHQIFISNDIKKGLNNV